MLQCLFVRIDLGGYDNRTFRIEDLDKFPLLNTTFIEDVYDYLILNFKTDGSVQKAGFSLSAKFVCDNRPAYSNTTMGYGDSTSDFRATTQSTQQTNRTNRFDREQKLLCKNQSMINVQLDCSSTLHILTSNGSYYVNESCGYNFMPMNYLKGVNYYAINKFIYIIQ